MARAALNIGVRELAEAAKVSTNTITRLEAGELLKPRTVEAVQRALEDAGIEFIPANGGGPGARLRNRPAGLAGESKPPAGTKTAPSRKARQRPPAGRRRR